MERNCSPKYLSRRVKHWFHRGRTGRELTILKNSIVLVFAVFPLGSLISPCFAKSDSGVLPARPEVQESRQVCMRSWRGDRFNWCLLPQSYRSALNSVSRKVRKRWRCRNDLSGFCSCEVRFETTESGYPKRLRTYNQSSSAAFNEHCLKVVRNAGPFSEVPPCHTIVIQFQNTPSGI